MPLPEYFDNIKVKEQYQKQKDKLCNINVYKTLRNTWINAISRGGKIEIIILSNMCSF